MNQFADGHVRVFASDLTLEYDLAKAGIDNSGLMAEAWMNCFINPPAAGLTVANVDALQEIEAKAVLFWRHICLSESSRGKAEFAQSLVDLLSTDLTALGKSFTVPQYLQDAIRHVAGE